MALFVELSTSVDFLLGVRNIWPGFGLVAPTEITLGEIRSSCPSTTLRTGAVLAPEANSGLETKTWTRIADGLASGGSPIVLLRLLLLPQATRLAPATATSRISNRDRLKRGAPKNIRNGQLDARSGIIAELFRGCARSVRTYAAAEGLPP